MAITEKYKTYNIKVTQKHIDDAAIASLFIVEQPRFCPIALALYENLTGKTYKVKRRPYNKKRKQIVFDGSQMFSVAETIRWQGYGLIGQTHMHPPMDIGHTKDTAKFINSFDEGKAVNPIEFTIQLPEFLTPANK